MSQANVELMARALRALNERDDEVLAELISDELEWRPALTAGGQLEGRVYRGPHGAAEFRDDLDSAFAEWHFDVEGFEAVGPDRVLYKGLVSARGKASGVPLETHVWGVWSIRDGKLVRGDGYLNEAEARKAAGLEA